MKMLTLVLSPYFLSIVKINSHFQTSSVCDDGAFSVRFRRVSPAQLWGRVKALGTQRSAAGGDKRCWPKPISAHVAYKWGPHSHT